MKEDDKYTLFVYGTLMWQEVLSSVIGRICPMEKALLKGFKRCRIKGQIYPGIKKDPDSTVRGQLIRGLNEKDLQRLDRFEGQEYKRIKVTVINSHGEKEEVFTYVIKEEYLSILEDFEWRESDFTEDKRARFLRREFLD